MFHHYLEIQIMMTRLIINFKYIPTLEDLELFIKTCHYDLSSLFFKDDIWNIPNNDISELNEMNGLGLFYKPTDDSPAFIFNCETRNIFVLDVSLLQKIAIYNTLDVLYIDVTSKDIYRNTFDFYSMFCTNTNKEKN